MSPHPPCANYLLISVAMRQNHALGKISWLHLTDLHLGLQGAKPTWPVVRDIFYRDLEWIHTAAGPFELILFSGDLVQSGTEQEYDMLTAWLDGELLPKLAAMGSRPVLLAVPGNHDLVWPDSRDPSVRMLRQWSNDQELRDMIFWHQSDGASYREVIRDVFKPFTAWMQAWYTHHPLPDSIRLSPGLLPGEWSASVHKNGLNLGIVGLNSAFLQLGKGMGVGKLALHPFQLHALCDGRPDNWAEQHHLRLLMTHHPPEWLEPGALSLYHQHICAPQWFDAHLCGHTHVPDSLVQVQGGALPRRLLRGISLFGLEQWQHESGAGEDRLHGYTAYRFDSDGPSATLRIWPRMALVTNHQWQIVPDYQHFVLQPDNSYPIPITFDEPLRVQARQPPRSSSAPSTPDQPPRVQAKQPPGDSSPQPVPPGTGYDPKWYVERGYETTAILNLSVAGVPVTVASPPRHGKSVVLGCIVDRLRHEDKTLANKGIVVSIDVGKISPEALEGDDPAQCIRELAEELVIGYRRALGDQTLNTDRWVEAEWTRPLSPERKLSHLLETRLLHNGHGRVVLVFDRFERLIGPKPGYAVARMLRTWVEDSKWDATWQPLRILLAATATSLLFRSTDPVSELFEATMHIHLERFASSEIRACAALFGSDWSAQELKRVEELVGGHPYLTHVIFFHDAGKIPRAHLLDADRLTDVYLMDSLRQMWLQIREREDILKPFCALLHDRAVQLNADQYELLRRQGLVFRQDGHYVIPNQLLANYVRQRC